VLMVEAVEFLDTGPGLGAVIAEFCLVALPLPRLDLRPASAHCHQLRRLGLGVPFLEELFPVVQIFEWLVRVDGIRGPDIRCLRIVKDVLRSHSIAIARPKMHAMKIHPPSSP